MVSVRLDSGVILHSNNDSVIQQYLKYGAVEIAEKEVVKPKKVVEDAPKKTTKSRKVD